MIEIYLKVLLLMLLMFVINIIINKLVAFIKAQSPHLGIVLYRTPEEGKWHGLKRTLFSRDVVTWQKRIFG